jgi:2-iminobutanoate/2-iminopropanoate deaminase
MKKIIETPKAPAAIGPYSQAVEAGGILFLSGQIPLDPDAGKILDSDIKSQTLRVLKNIEAILAEAGYTFSDVVKSTCYLSDMANFKAMNEVYSTYYVEKQPARVTLAVKELPLGALIEIETIAVKGAGK